MIKIRELRVRAGFFEVSVERLETRKGEYLVVMGPSGAGKTMLLETIAGFRKPLAGTIEIEGVDVTRLPPEKRRVGLVPQNYALWPHMTVYENIAYGLKLRRLPGEEIKRRVHGIAEMVGIDHLLGRTPSTLSGGEQQRVALARALAVQPRVMLLDEPLSNLDQASAERIKELLMGLHRRLGCTAIHVTHDPQEAAELGDRIAVMHKGRILQVGDPLEVARNPILPEAAHLHGTATLLKGVVVSISGAASVDVEGISIMAAGGHIDRCLEGYEALILVRPEDVVLFKHPPSDTSARNMLGCRVRGTIPRGPLVLIDLLCGNIELRSLVTRGSYEELGLKEGSETYASFKAASTSVIRCRPPTPEKTN